MTTEIKYTVNLVKMQLEIHKKTYRYSLTVKKELSTITNCQVDLTMGVLFDFMGQSEMGSFNLMVLKKNILIDWMRLASEFNAFITILMYNKLSLSLIDDDDDDDLYWKILKNLQFCHIKELGAENFHIKSTRVLWK